MGRVSIRLLVEKKVRIAGEFRLQAVRGCVATKSSFPGSSDRLRQKQLGALLGVFTRVAWTSY